MLESLSSANDSQLSLLGHGSKLLIIPVFLSIVYGIKIIELPDLCISMVYLTSFSFVASFLCVRRILLFFFFMK